LPIKGMGSTPLEIFCNRLTLLQPDLNSIWFLKLI
jgi:hypothetical protein